MTSDRGDTVSLYFLFFASILAIVLLMSKALHSRPKLNSTLSEPAMVLLVGMFVSFLVSFFFLLEDKISKDHVGDDDHWKQQQDQDDALTQTILSFPNKVFFMALLPPILFNSGYQLQRELFYRHIKPIFLFAALGTTVSAMVTGSTLYGIKLLGWLGEFDPTYLELLTFGALIAATDTVSVLGVLQAKRVDPHLFSLVFGESALNDAVAIVLYRSFSAMLVGGVGVNLADSVGAILLDFFCQAVGSPFLGIVFAFFTALLFKYVDLRETKMLELGLFILLMYFPFVLAEELHLSGIVAIFFTGLSAKRYIEPNVSEDTRRNADAIFQLVAYLAETCIFLELGLSTFGLSGSFQWKFIAFAFLAALFSRAVMVYPISFLFNVTLAEKITHPLLEDDDRSIGSNASSSNFSRFSGRPGHERKRRIPEKRRDKKIPTSFMHVLWLTGLRGAVAYSCARDFPNLYGNNDEFIACTMVIVFMTVVFMGGCIEPLLDIVQVTMNVDEKEYMKEWRARRRLKGCYHDFEYKYIYKKAVREDSQKEEDDEAQLLASFLDRHPMPEIQLLPMRHTEQEPGWDAATLAISETSMDDPNDGEKNHHV